MKRKKKECVWARVDLGFAAVTLSPEGFVVQLCDAVAILWGGVGVWGSEFRVQDSGFRVCDAGFSF